MPSRCRKQNSDKDADGIIAIIILAIIMMPIVGVYLLFFGKNEKQRGIGLILLIIYLLCWITSKF